MFSFCGGAVKNTLDEQTHILFVSYIMKWIILIGMFCIRQVQDAHLVVLLAEKGCVAIKILPITIQNYVRTKSLKQIRLNDFA